MARMSDATRALMNSLIRQGVIPDEAADLAANATKKLQSFKSGKNRGDFMAALQVMNQNAPFSNVRDARKAMKADDYKQKGFTKRDLQEKQIVLGTPESHYIVYTTLPKQFVKDLLVQVLDDWIDFARGESSLGGRSLKNPSGRYASSISAKQQSANFFTIFADAPYADALESGHRQVNLKQYIDNFTNNHNGEYVDIPLGRNSAIRNAAKGGAKVAGNSSKFSAASSVSPKAAQAAYMKRYSGVKKGGNIRRMTPQSKGWLIPPMRAYHPAYHLWQKLSRELKLMEKVLI